MNDELTKVDIAQMKKELAHRQSLIPAQLAEVKRTREYGDLSENDEYRCAKRELGQNRSRIRYLQSMIRTAVVIDTSSAADEVGLFDRVEVRFPDDGEQKVFRIVTTLRVDVFKDAVSKESPFGKALLGAHVGDVVQVQVNEQISYPVEVISITKGTDDPDLPIRKY